MSLIFISLILFLRICGQTEPTASEILLRTQAKIRTELFFGKTIKSALQLDVIFERGNIYRFTGGLVQKKDEMMLELIPSIDPSMPEGEPFPGTVIRIHSQGQKISWSVEGSDLSIAKNQAAEFLLPEVDELIYSPLIPPKTWAELEFSVKESGFDPHSLLQSKENLTETSLDRLPNYWVLSTKNAAEIVKDYKGHLELWIHRDTLFMEQIVVTLQKEGSDNEDEILRAIISFDEIQISN